MTTAAVIVATMCAPFVIYIAARLVFAAYFFTKRQYEERRKNHG